MKTLTVENCQFGENRNVLSEYGARLLAGVSLLLASVVELTL